MSTHTHKHTHTHIYTYKYFIPRSMKQISLQMIKELQIILKLSLNKTGQLVSTLRKGMGSKSAVENNIFGKMYDLEESILHFYQVEKVTFIYLFLFKLDK